MPERAALSRLLSIGALSLGVVACADVLGIKDLRFDRESPASLEIEPAAGAGAMGGAGPVTGGTPGVPPVPPPHEYPTQWAPNLLIVSDPFTEPGVYRVYDPATGTLEKHSLADGGYRIDELGTWESGFDHLLQFSELVEADSGPTPVLFGYDSVSGLSYRLTAEAPPTFPGEVSQTTEVWTHLTALRGGHYVAYHAESGHYRVGHQDTGASFVGEWPSGFTHVVAFQLNGVVGALRFDATTGLLSFAPLTEEGDLIGGSGEGVEGFVESPTYTHVVPVTINDETRLLFYDTNHGQVLAVRVSGNASNELVITEVEDAIWDGGRDQIVPLRGGERPCALVYGSETGAVDLRGVGPLLSTPILK